MSDPFIHPTAEVHSSSVGLDTRIWQYSVVLISAKIGERCNICSHCFIENDVVVGDRVTVKCGVQLWDGLRVEDDVFIGPNVTFTNDKHPRSQQYPEEFVQTVVKKGASIGANATILPGLTIGANAMIGAGAVVTHDVPAGAMVMGNPAQISGYSNVEKVEMTLQSDLIIEEIKVKGVSLHQLQHVPDLRGSLCVAEIGKELPFAPKRMFFVYDVPAAKIRGEHAHKECHQFLICLRGSVRVIVDDAKKRQEVLLNSPMAGLYLKPGVWGVQYHYSSDSILLVMASHAYEEKDYLRDYNEFLEWTNNQ